MAFRGMCNCSCQRLDVVEHSGDDGRETEAAAERALDLEKAHIGAAELERLGCALAARVPRKTQKISGAYVARAFERAEAERALAAEGLDARTAAASLRAMEDAGLARHVATGPAGDLLRLDDSVLPCTLRVVVQSVRVRAASAASAPPGLAPPGLMRSLSSSVRRGNPDIGVCRARYGGGDWCETVCRVEPAEEEARTYVVDKKTVMAFELPAAVVKGQEPGKPVEIEFAWTDARGRASFASYSYSLEVVKHGESHLHEVGHERVLEEATARSQRGCIGVWYADSIYGVEMSRELMSIVPPERELRDAKGVAAYVRCFCIATPGIQAVTKKELDNRAWDDASRDWSVFCKLEDVRGARLGAEGVISVLGGDYVVTVGAKLREPGRRPSPEAKSAAAAKDWLEHGGDWGAGAGEDVQKEGDLVVVHGDARRATGTLRLVVYERLRTDMLETHQLGHVDVPLLDLPVVRDPAQAPTVPEVAHLRRFAIQSRSLITGKDNPNGVIRATIWMQARSRESQSLKRALARWPYAAGAATAGAGALAARVYGPALGCVVALWLALSFLRLELPRLLGRALGWVIRQAAPGLGLYLEACEVRLGLWPLPKGGADLRLAVDCQGVTIKNAGPGYVKDDFVAADDVRIVLRFDRQCLHRGISLALEALRRLRRGDEKKEAPEGLSAQFTVNFGTGGRAKPGDVVFVKLTTTDKEPITVGRSKTGTLDDALTAELPPFDVCPLKLGAGAVDVVAYRVKHTRADDFLGLVARVSQESMHLGHAVQHALTLRGAWVGHVMCALTRHRCDRHQAAAPLVRWNPFPAKHARLRAATPGAPPTRLSTIVIDDLRVRGARVAFGMAHGEFNVNHFVRAIDAGKVRAALPRHQKDAPPNVLRVTVCGGSGLPAKCYVSLSLRGTHRTSATRNARGDGKCAVFEPHCPFEFQCPDPSAVIVASLVDAHSRAVVGRWLVTTKMLVLAPTNVYGRDLVASSAEAGPARYSLKGTMELRGPGGQLLEGEGEARLLELELEYAHDPRAPTLHQMLERRPVTALDQLRMNSLETKLRLGNVRLAARMLEDFPVLLDVRACFIAEAKVWLSDLFSGYEGRGESLKHRFGAKNIMAALRPADDEDENPQDHSDHIYLPVLDLKDACKFEGGLSLGEVVSRLLSPQVVTPILSRLNITHAAFHLASGGRLFQRKKKKPEGELRGSDAADDVSQEYDEANNGTAHDLLDPSHNDEEDSVTDSGRTSKSTVDTLREKLPRASIRDFFRNSTAVVKEHALDDRGQDQLREKPVLATTFLRLLSAATSTRPTPFRVELHGASLYCTRLKSDRESRNGYTRVIPFAGADLDVDDDEIALLLPSGGGKLLQGRPTVILRVPDTVSVKERAKTIAAWKDALLRAKDFEHAVSEHISVRSNSRM